MRLQTISGCVVVCVFWLCQCARKPAESVRAVVTAPVAEKASEEKVSVAGLEPAVVKTGLPDTGLRLPNLLEMPAEAEFKPVVGGQEAGGGVISRPPSESTAKP
jgi:hypothetical protein